MLTANRGSVRFTAYPEGSARPNVVICLVTKDALEYLSRDSKLGSEKMVQVYELHSKKIRKAAALMFETGTAEPVVTEAILKASAAIVE